MTSKGLISKSKIDAIKTAIRAKGAGSFSMTLDQMATAIGTIGGGSEDSLADQLLDGSVTSITSNVTTLRQSACSPMSNLVSVNFPNITAFSANCFMNCWNLANVVAPKVTGIVTNCFYGCSSLKVCDLPSLQSISINAFGGNALETLVLRRTDAIVSVASGGLNNTQFASGKNGGTIYIPKVLYDHLGDGTALDYKANANWATYDGYGTITWAKIEGSQYE